MAATTSAAVSDRSQDPLGISGLGSARTPELLPLGTLSRMEEALAGGAADDPLAAEAAEVRRLIEAGASSPEELRALAARLRELREREEARWRSEVRPALVKKGRGRLRRHDVEVPPPPLTWPPAPGAPLGVEPAGPAGPGEARTEPVGDVPLAPPAAPVGPAGTPMPSAWPAPPSDAVPPPPPGVAPVDPQRRLWAAAGLLLIVGLAVVAANTSIWVLVLPVLGLLAWAWAQGRQDTEGGPPR